MPNSLDKYPSPQADLTVKTENPIEHKMPSILDKDPSPQAGLKLKTENLAKQDAKYLQQK